VQNKYETGNPPATDKLRRVARRELDAEYARMAADQLREAEAREWADALLPDVADPAS
jgi:hypothetical protein